MSKKGKVPGPDNFGIDLLKDSGEIICRKLRNLFTTHLKQNKITGNLNDAIIV